ncbi:response regulator [Metallumcola ferriviriculae]|uniref:Stage 0 sporulation protein A homolog n=1 Tax=Metallumcola ferriviriculae TaxID=3039180 RepID=A0AAU0UTN7_9FIRM|nr:response regulator [Desulfitibacteraceae bacterium MK1]
MEQITVVIVDDIAQTRQDISRLLYFEKDVAVIGEAANGNEAIEIVESSSPDVVLMDINMPGLDGIKATEEITSRYPNVAIIMISIQGEQEYLKKAMMAGAREYLTKPFSGDELANTIRQVNQLTKRRAGAGTEGQSLSKMRRGKVISIFSGKGGSGKSFIAVNLGVVLAKTAKVAILDLDTQFGDVAIMLGLSPKRTLEQLLEEDRMDWEVLQSYLLPHLSGVQVLPSVGNVGSSEKINRGFIENIINVIKDRFDFIILDMATGFNELNLMAIDKADLIFQVVTPDIPALKSAISARSVFDSLGFLNKVHLLENFAGISGGLKSSVIEQNLKTGLGVSIPWGEKEILNAVNKGMPPLLGRAPEGMNDSFKKLSGIVGGSAAAVAEGPGLFKKIFSF